MKTNRTTQKRKAANKNAKKAKAISLNEFEGAPYAGVPNSLKWHYGKGNWNESRRSSKCWDISYETIVLKAFESDLKLPVDSEHHSYILAHQKLIKTRNNTYKVKLEGLKFKLAHKIAGENWNTNSSSRKNELIRVLKQVLNDLEAGNGQAPSETKKVSAKGVRE